MSQDHAHIDIQWPRQFFFSLNSDTGFVSSMALHVTLSVSLSINNMKATKRADNNLLTFAPFVKYQLSNFKKQFLYTFEHEKKLNNKVLIMTGWVIYFCLYWFLVGHKYLKRLQYSTTTGEQKYLAQIWVIVKIC